MSHKGEAAKGAPAMQLATRNNKHAIHLHAFHSVTSHDESC